MAAAARVAAMKGAKRAGAKKVMTKMEANLAEDKALLSEQMRVERKRLAHRNRVHTAADYRAWGPLAHLLACWKNAALEVRQLLVTDAWEYSILATIIFAGVLVGVQTFPGYEEDQMVKWLDLVVLGIFTLEVLLKIFAQGFRPWRFWTAGDHATWNCFDFTVVLLCMPFMPGGGSYLAVLRLARLARLIKIVDKVPELKMIVMGMIGGMRAIFFIFCLLFLVFYLFAIAGIVLFEENDPWHFGCFADSVTTLFRMSTMEDWTDIMYINYYGCDRYHSGIYHNATAAPLAGTAIMEAAVCRTPKAKPVTSTLFCVSFVIIAGLVMFSMFVGAVSLSMTSSIDEINEQQTETRRAKRLERAKEQLARRFNGSSASVLTLGDDPDDDDGEEEGGGGSVAGGMFLAPEVVAPEEFERQRRLAQILNEVWDGEGNGDDGGGVSCSSVCCCCCFGCSSGGGEQEDRLAGISRPGRVYLTLVSDPTRKFVRSSAFTSFLLAVIIAACILVGFQTDPRIKDDPDVLPILHRIDRGATFVFCVECVLKIVGEGLRPWAYFASFENLFDFFIVVGSFVFDSGLFILLRLVRLFRVLKLVKSVPELKMHVTALIKGVESIKFIGCIMFIFFYVYGIVAWMMFKDNDPWHFANVGHAMLTLFRCATFEDWTDVMYINKFGCDRYGYTDFPDECVNPYAWGGYAVLFMMTFETIGSLVLLNLFIGVITASMDESSDDMKNEKEMEVRIAEIADECGISRKAVAVFRDVFDMLDLDQSQTLEAEELRAALDAIGKNPSDDELTQLYAEADHGGEGQIDMADFILFMHNASKVQGGFSEAHVALKKKNPAAGAVKKNAKAKGGAKFVL